MLSELCDKGWQVVEPPRQEDGPSVIARYRGEPIRAGFQIDKYADTESELHVVYRSGKYNVELRLDFDAARGLVRVSEAEGYDDDESPSNDERIESEPI